MVQGRHYITSRSSNLYKLILLRNPTTVAGGKETCLPERRSRSWAAFACPSPCYPPSPLPLLHPPPSHLQLPRCSARVSPEPPAATTNTTTIAMNTPPGNRRGQERYRKRTITDGLEMNAVKINGKIQKKIPGLPSEMTVHEINRSEKRARQENKKKIQPTYKGKYTRYTPWRADRTQSAHESTRP